MSYRRYRTRRVWRRAAAFFALLLAAVAAAAAARADELGRMIGEPGPDRIAKDVSIAGTVVGGMTGGQAARAVEASFRRPIALVLQRETVFASPVRLGGVPLVTAAVDEALGAAPGEAVRLSVLLDRPRLLSYSARLARAYSRPAVDANVRLRRFRPVISKPKIGLNVGARPVARELAAALRAGARRPIEIPYAKVRPHGTRAQFRAAIVIRRSSNRLHLYRGARRWRTFPVATGQSTFPTPLGRFTVVSKQRNPWWYPPDSSWARGLQPVPPGPGNPLGTRWMGLSGGGIGIHGTPDAASIGYSASHGCIRMRIPDAEWLFEHVAMRTTVFIVS